MQVLESSNQYRAVVIGCGNIGSQFSELQRGGDAILSHAQAFVEHRQTALVGVSDVDAQRQAAAQKFWNVEAANSDPVTLCRELKPDIISLCTPDKTHYDLSRRLLLEAAPRILFVEKPLASTVAEAEDLLKLADEAGCAITVNYSRRFSPAFQALKKELADELHGKPVLARFIYGKGLLHNGSHALDLLRFWLGEVAESHGTPEHCGLGGDENYSVDLRFENGCRARLDTFNERIATVFELDFLAEKSRWRFSLGGNAWEFYEVAPSPVYAGYFNYLPTRRENRDPLFTAPLTRCLLNAVENIVEFLDDEVPLICTGEDGLAVIKLVERIRETK